MSTHCVCGCVRVRKVGCGQSIPFTGSRLKISRQTSSTLCIRNSKLITNGLHAVTSIVWTWAAQQSLLITHTAGHPNNKDPQHSRRQFELPVETDCPCSTFSKKQGDYKDKVSQGGANQPLATDSVADLRQLRRHVWPHTVTLSHVFCASAWAKE